MTDQQPEDAAWVHVPDGVGAEMDGLADNCRALVNAWFDTARGLAASPTAGSPAAAAAQQLTQAMPDAPVNVEYGPGQQACLYVDAIGQHLLAVEALLRTRRIAVAVWPLVRAELEVAGRVGWLLDPRVDQRVGEAQVARLFLELISSLQRERFTAGKYDSTKEKRAKKLRDEKIAEAKSVFDQVEVDLTSPDKIESWNINGEVLPGLGAAANLFVDLHFSGKAKALYDFLSDYSHPSLMAIARQTMIIDVDGVSTRPWTVGVDIIEHQVRLACVILYKTARLVAGYYELDASALERWVDAVPTAWFGPGDDDVAQP